MAKLLRRYKDTMVGQGSALALALETQAKAASQANEAASRLAKKEVEKIYEETTNAYKRMYSEEDRNWFHQMSFPPKPMPTE